MLNAKVEEEDMKPVCSLLALVLTMQLLTAASGHSDVAMNITAGLGHSVTFRCPSTHSKPVNGLYIQRVKNDKEVFINGFYKGHPMPVNPEYQNRTKVNEMELSMEMRNISVSDEGLYKCYVLNNILNTPDITLEILLKVTAEYSVPTVRTNCSEHKHSDGGTGMSCQLSCSAMGGYPRSTITWMGLNPSLTSVVYNWNSADNDSKTWTINQTIMYNCKQLTNVGCAIGGALSYTVTICHSDVAMNITAGLGHSVTFRCPSTHSKPVNGLYIQRVKNDKEVFINGFYKDHPMPVNPEYQNRTKVNEMELSMEMRNISVSDEGLYKCYVFNNILNTPDITLEILLKVTAEYSVPTVRTNCSEHKHSDGGTGMSCQLSCSAMGGYPRSTITWMGLNPSLTSVVYNLNSADNDSKTWTINQTIMYNCKQLTNVGCAIGGALSYTVTICHSDVAMNITAVLGHSVTFKCPSTHSKPVNGLYIQRMKNDKEVFINGFYKGHPMPVNSEYQNRTKVNEMELSMEMRNISVSDEGLYKCVVFYSTLDKMETMINLKVTAEYSVPTIKKDCIKRNDGSTGESCQLSCSAVGGYPQSTVTWVGLNSSEMSGFYNRNLADNVSETWTINQTIIFNCDQPISVSCAIADAVSYTITICEKESFSLQVIIAIIVVLAFVLLILVIIVMKCCCRRSETRRLEDQVDGADIPLADCHSQLENVTTKP
ncbi:uncharacterized protein LOC127176991 isoform X2 [Labeo rohita]|uniref:uncharacterized protein LOC127176991 isoform X2 n=1 Tax=Labeo rohita TaxID=84645 RepID=UPI0021E32175|nr:uncharacterized protein LOC127176991 isoform X2 [Labeo rohita]